MVNQILPVERLEIVPEDIFEQVEIPTTLIQVK